MGRLAYILRCIAHMDYRALLETVGEAHKASGKNRLWLFFDIVQCGFRYGAGYKDYLLCAFYDLNDRQRATYVTRGINNSIVSRLNDPNYYHIFDNKLDFYRTFAAYLHRDWLDFTKVSETEFEAFVEKHPSVIVKPADASCGIGVEKLDRADYPDVKAMYDDIRGKGAALVEEVVHQHSEMERLNPGSVNTVRVYTVLAEGEAHAVYACVRMGNSDRPVDNINAGGMYSPVDLETGGVTCAACDKQRIVYEVHPRSGCRIEGFQVPFWKESIALCCEAAHVVPQMGYVGWDVAVTEKGPLFIEANNMPGHDAFPQMPLQAPDKIGILPVFQKYIPGL